MWSVDTLHQKPSNTARCRSQAQREEEQSAALREMGPEYLEEGYDSVAAELARLPPGFDAGVLDAIVDRRSWVLEVRVKMRSVGIGQQGIQPPDAAECRRPLLAHAHWSGNHITLTLQPEPMGRAHIRSLISNASFSSSSDEVSVCRRK